MKKSSVKNETPSCGCTRTCRCQPQFRCRCHDTNALLALTLWDYGRMVRRHRSR